MVKMTFIKDQQRIEVNAKIGQTLLEVARENNVDLIGACDGNCACGSCHVYIDENTLKKITPAKEEENVLDVVFNIKPNSRLACQVVVSEDLENAIITIPS